LPTEQKHLAEYYGALPVVTPGGDVMLMFNTFCEFLWQDPAFVTLDLSSAHSHSRPIGIKYDEENDLSGLLDARSMERRYSFENQMIRAVSLGQLHMENRLFSSLSGNLFETRVADPIRNSKNYCIIMNTLLRKGAEAGGVHPLHINRLSSDFAKKIEELPSLSDVTSLMTEMFRAYCRLVRKHSVKKYSPPVRRAILRVDADLSAELTPGRLAKEQNLSLGYLSSEFSREVGKPLAAFIRERRMEYAAYLLSTTELQIQTVAQYCGILDVQYFSKIFKKYYGKTPTDYRKYERQNPASKV
jgi:AraC-like DNA-binding protein